MPTTLTLKNIPDLLYGNLKQSAELNRRSLNSEVIVQLESRFSTRRPDATERLARARQLRDSLPTGAFNAADIADFAKAGRA